MNIKDSKRLIELAMKANVPHMLVGHSGVGKSQIERQIAAKVFPNHKFVPIFASQCDVGDFIGIPDIKTVGKDRVTSWARPEWMPYEPCVIFLDELNNARPDVESAMLQLVLEKRIHTHELHPDSYICAAINPPNPDYTTANTMNTALVKRFMVISFEPQTSEFIDWGNESKRVHPKILSFLKAQPGLSGAEKGLDTLIKLEPCPRLWTEAVSKIFAVLDKEGKAEDRDIVRDVLISTLGVNTAAVYLSWLDTQDKPVSVKEIVEDPKAAIKRYNEFYNSARTDLISATTENILNSLYEMHEKLVGKFNYKVSILEYDRNSDQAAKNKAVDEVKRVIKEEFTDSTRKKLNALVAFLNEVPNDVIYQISHAITVYKPCLDRKPSEDEEAYHKEQIKRFETWNTLAFYLLRDDLTGIPTLGKKFNESTAEIEKHKKKEKNNE